MLSLHICNAKHNVICKGNANREENKMNSFIFYPEMQLIFCKGKQKNMPTRIFFINCFATIFGFCVV